MKVLMTNVLRGEWGMKGFRLTDFSGNAQFESYGLYMKTFDVARRIACRNRLLGQFFYVMDK